jgi:glycosyltransferase involved in cell wall biosynthesis
MKRKLKIGIIVDQLLAGGVQLAAIEQIKQLNKMGHQTTLIILMRKKYTTDFSFLTKDIPHRFLSDSYPKILQKTYKFPIFSFFSTLHLLSPILAPRVIKKNEYDIFISLGTTTSLTTQQIYQKAHIPYIAVIHDPFEYILKKAYSKTSLRFLFPILKPLTRYFEKSFVKDAKKTLIISKVHYNYLKHKYNINPEILGFGTRTLAKLPNKRGNFMLSFGRWQKEKNPLFLLKLLKTIPQIKLVIAGSWTSSIDFNNFQKIIKNSHLENRVSLIPNFEQEELDNLCRKSLLWVYPHFEAFGLAGLEAAGHGLPIIIPEKSGVTEKFTHGVHGFFPKNVDVKTYKSYILRLAKNKKLAYTMGKKAWKQTKKEFSWEANTKHLLAIINETLDLIQKKQIIVLETSHTIGTGGGDKLIEPMARRLSPEYYFTIITSKIGIKHWHNSPIKKGLIQLSSNNFDGKGDPIPVFLTYCYRMWQTYKILHKQKESSILLSSTNILPDILPAYLCKNKLKASWIARIHHLIPPPHKRSGKFIVNTVSYCMQIVALKMIKRRATFIIALNENLKIQLIQMGFPSSQLFVIGAGITFQDIANYKPNKKMYFDAVVLGRLHPAKGIFDIVPIWKEVSNHIPNASVAVIGQGPESIKKELQMQIKNAHLSSQIKIFGYLPYNAIYTIMKQSKTFIFLDHEAGWGLAIAEAMACGLPVIGYNVDVFGKIYIKGYITVPCFDTKQFTYKILSLLQNNKKRELLAKSAIKQAKKLDWSYTTKQFSHLLKQIPETYRT